MKKDVDETSVESVVIVLTVKQAEFLHALLDGFIGREAGNAIGTPSIIRKASQIGKRLSDAAGFRWRHKSR
jgi:hypothetical protein